MQYTSDAEQILNARVLRFCKLFPMRSAIRHVGRINQVQNRLIIARQRFAGGRAPLRDVIEARIALEHEASKLEVRR